MSDKHDEMAREKVCPICQKSFTKGRHDSVKYWKTKILCSRACKDKYEAYKANSATEKTCAGCKRNLPIDRFQWRGGNRNTRKSHCIDCERVRYRAWYRTSGVKKPGKSCADPVKRHARSLLQSAVRRGLIVRRPCEVCGDAKSDAHHDNYSKPYDVRWLCRVHHGHEHRISTDTPLTEEAAAPRRRFSR